MGKLIYSAITSLDGYIEDEDGGEPLPASIEGANMRRIAAEHRRLLGNGHCTRPTGLDCNFKSILRTMRVLRDRTPVPGHPSAPTR